MASKHVRWSPTKVTSNYVTPTDKVADMGAYRVVGVQCRRLKVQGSSQVCYIQHNSTLDDDGWLNTTASFNLDGTGSDWAEITSFSRHLRLWAPAGADGSGVLLTDLIGKE